MKTTMQVLVQQFEQSDFIVMTGVINAQEPNSPGHSHTFSWD